MSKLPDTWVFAPLGSLLSAIWGGGTPSKVNADHFRGSIPFMTVKDMHKRFIDDTQDHITEAALSGSASAVVPADTLIVASRMSLGKIARPRVPVAINQDLKALFLNAGIDKTFVEYAWKANEARIREMGTGTTVKGIRLEDIRSLEVPVAPSAEQTRIADQLDALLAHVNSCNSHLDTIPGILKRFRQAVLNAAAREDFLNGTPEVPFRVVRLSEVLREPLRNGKSVRDGSGMSVLRLNSIKFSGIDLRKTKTGDWSDIADATRFLIQNGDYLVSRGNGSKTLVGRGGLVSECMEKIAFPDTMIRIRTDHAELLPDYLKYVWASQFVRDQIELSAKTTAGIWKISQPDLENVRLPLPEISAQQGIVRQVNALLRLADHIESRYTTLRVCAKRLVPQVLAKAFRGELVEQDPQDEPASVLLQRLAGIQPTKASNARGRPRSQPEAQPLEPVRPPINWASLPNGAWAAPADPNGQAATAWLTAVLRSWERPMPEQTARLAVLLCQQPRLFTLALTDRSQAMLWSRLVGDEAKPLPSSVTRLQSATNSPWGRAIQGMRVRGDLIEAEGGGDAGEVTWALGPGAASIETAGWPDGRAGFVVAHLRAHSITSILPALDAAAQEFVHARAA